MKREKAPKDVATYADSAHVVQPRQQRSRDALAKIVGAAEHILRTDGVEGFSMTEVASISGLAIGNIYRRFLSKADLLLAIKENVTARLEQAVLSKLGSQFDTADEFIADFALGLTNTFAQDETIHRVLFDPRLRTPAMDQLGYHGRRRIFLHYQEELSGFLPGVDARARQAMIAVSFNIIVYAAVARAMATDPLLKSLSWKTVASEYGTAAAEYIRVKAASVSSSAAVARRKAAKKATTKKRHT